MGTIGTMGTIGVLQNPMVSGTCAGNSLVSHAMELALCGISVGGMVEVYMKYQGICGTRRGLITCKAHTGTIRVL